MSETEDYELDLRDVPPPRRHPLIMRAFEELDKGEHLTLINDHEPKPLYHQMAAEVEDFDEDNYKVEQVDTQKFVAKLPKK